MTDEFDLRKDMAKGAQAQAALSDPALASAFDLVEADYVDAWKATDARDSIAREMAWMAIAVLNNVRRKLQKAVDDGKVAQKQLEPDA